MAHPIGPGNALVLEIEAEHATAVFTGFGERGRSAEEVGRQAVSAAQTWLDADVPEMSTSPINCCYRQLLAGGGDFRTTKPSLPATTNATVIRRFLSVAIGFEPENALVWSVNAGTG